MPSLGIEVFQLTEKAILVRATDGGGFDDTRMWIPRSQITAWYPDDSAKPKRGREEIELGDTGVIDLTAWFYGKLGTR